MNQLNQIKYCPSCGYGMQSGFAYCPRCGSGATGKDTVPPWQDGPDSRQVIQQNRTADQPESRKSGDRSRIRLEELDGFETVPSVYVPEQRRNPRVGKDYIPPWQDPDAVPVRPEMMRYRDTDRDTGGFGWWLLGFLLPLAGLIMYLSWRERTPERARSVGSGAFSMLVLLAALTVVFSFLYMNGYLVFT